jgi:hypothetical protein
VSSMAVTSAHQSDIIIQRSRRQVKIDIFKYGFDLLASAFLDGTLISAA